MSEVDAGAGQPGPRRARGNWFAVAAYALLAAATQLLWLTFAPLTTEASSYYGVSEGAIGFLSIIFPLAYVVLAIPCGLALDRWFRPSLLVGGLLTAVGALVRLAGDSSYEFALAGQIIVAIAQPFVLSAVTKLSVNYLPKPQRPAGIAIGSAGLFLGMVVSFLSGATIGDNLPLILAIGAAVAVLALLLIAVALSRPGRFSEDVELGNAETVESATKRPLRTIWADPVLRLLVAVVGVGNGVFVALTTWLQPMLDPAGVSPSSAGSMLLIMVIAGVVGAVTVPTIAAKHHNQTMWMFVAISVTGLGSLVLAAAPGETTGFVVSALTGFLLLAMLPIVLEMVEQRAGPAVGTATALVWMAGNFGGVIIAALVGVAVSNPALGFALMAVLVLGPGFPIVLALRRHIRLGH